MPGDETILWTEQESAGTSITFGNIVWANPGAFFGYFVATYTDAAGNTVSRIKRIPLAGGFADVLATSPDVVVNGDLVTDGTTLFWVDRSGIRSMSVNGGPVITLFFGFGLGPLNFGSSNIYFSQGAAIHRMLKNGSAANIVVTAPGAITALHADVNNGRVYRGEHGGFVRSIFGGGGAITAYQGAQALRQITSVGFDGSRVLWTDCAVPGFNQCMVKKSQNGATTVVSRGSVGAGHLQWDTASMYWTDISGVRRFIQK